MRCPSLSIKVINGLSCKCNTARVLVDTKLRCVLTFSLYRGLNFLLYWQQDGVFLLPGCCDPFNDKALRASRGACFQLPIVSGNWNQLDNFRNGFQMKMLAGHPERKAAASLSQNLADSLMDKHVCLILGSEGLGLSEQSELKCELVSIPMAGDYESLNVSVAGGIFLFMLQPRNYIYD